MHHWKWKRKHVKISNRKKDIFISLIRLKSDMSMTVICHVMSIAVLYIERNVVFELFLTRSLPLRNSKYVNVVN
jgi:hypothetical protein